MNHKAVKNKQSLLLFVKCKNAPDIYNERLHMDQHDLRRF